MKTHIVSILNSIVIEPYMFLVALSFAITLIPSDQLQQDKICLYQYNQSADYCLGLSKSPTTPIKIAILASSNVFSLKLALIDSLPAIVWCLLVGSVCDRFPKTRKYFMILTSTSVLIKNTLVLLNLIFFDSWGKTPNV